MLRVFAALSRLLLCGLIGGVLVALAVYPGLYAVGNGADQAGAAFLSLPSVLQAPPQPQTSYVYANDGKTLITTFYDENRRDVPLDDVSEAMRQAMVAAEDSRFYQHGAVDLKAIARALVTDGRSGSTAQGASTLTMQYVRNVLKTDPDLTPQQRADAVADTPARKLREIRYAITLEQHLSKDEILDRYLNIAYFGAGAYGVAAASETYFNEPPSALTTVQAALIAGLVQSPDVDNPIDGDVKQAINRRTYVLEALVGMHVISADEATADETAPLGLHPHRAPNDCVAAAKSWGFFCDYFQQWWDQQAAFGLTVADREETLADGGYHIVTSLNPAVQAEAQKESLSVYGYNNAKALPIAAVQPGTGRVLALAVNRHYSLAPNPKGKPYPNTVDQLIAGGGDVAGYQTGSTFKLFTMLAALKLGYPLNTKFKAPAKLHTIWPDAGPSSCGGRYCPSNANPSWMDGERNMWTGYGRSVNTYWVWVEEQIGPANAVAMARNLGIPFRAPGDAYQADHAKNWGAFTLGVVSVTPLDLVNAYATVAAGGIYCKPLPVVSVRTRDGTALSVADPQCRRAVSADMAAAAVDAGRCPVAEQDYYKQCNGGTAPTVPGILGKRPVAGKTGSSEENATESFVGYTPQVAVAGTAADPANPHDHVGSFMESRVVVAVAHVLATAVKGMPYVNFPVPSRKIAFGTQPRKSGKTGKTSKTSGPAPTQPGPTLGPQPPPTQPPPTQTPPTQPPPTQAPPTQAPPTQPPVKGPPTQEPGIGLPPARPPTESL